MLTQDADGNAGVAANCSCNPSASSEEFVLVFLHLFEGNLRDCKNVLHSLIFLDFVESQLPDGIPYRVKVHSYIRAHGRDLQSESERLDQYM